MDLTGRSGIVAGGSSGIGFTIANTLARAGATVYAVSKTGQPRDTEGGHEDVIHVTTGVSDYGEMGSLIREIGENKGINFLINNAGIIVKCRAENFDDSDFGRIMKVNVSSIFKLSCLCYPYLKKSTGRGRIVSITSMAAHLEFSEMILYCASKEVVLSMTRDLTAEWSGDNVNASSITPGWFPSKMSQQMIDAERKAKILSRMPVHKFGDTRDIAEMAEYLMSDNTGYITGQDPAVDGGTLMFGF